MNPKPLTKELSGCLDELRSLCDEAITSLEQYVRLHHMGHLQHLAAETALWCRNMKRDLDMIFAEDAPRETKWDCSHYLEDLLGRADRLTKLTNSFQEHKGDYRLIHAFDLLAECVRLTTPPIMRWFHGFRGSSADKVVREKGSRIHALISQWTETTAAA